MLPRLCFRLLLPLLLLALPLLPARAQVRPPTPGSGLRGEYYDGKNFEKLVLTRLDPTIDFNWTTEGPNPARPARRFVAPGPDVPAEYFSVRWTGHLYAPVTGLYTFRMVNDDGMRVWVGGKRILNVWQDQVATATTAQVQLTGGRYYPLRVEYYQVQWDTRALLSWQLPESSAEPQPIPAANLYAALPSSAKPIPVSPPAPAAPVAAIKPAAPVPAKPRAAAPKPVVKPVVQRPRPVARPRRQPPVAPSADSAAPVLADLATLSRGAVLTLPNLYFTQSTAALLPTSRPTLNALVGTLRAQPALRLEIAGHTDNVGEPALNLRLSEQRARVVRGYLVQQGIDSMRLTARGYGGTRPVADNRDPKLRPRNRRVEVVVQ